MSIDTLRRDIVAIAIARGNTSIDHLEDIARDLVGLSKYIDNLSFIAKKDALDDDWSSSDPF